MGSVLKGAGRLFGSVGGGIAEGAGATSQFQAANPYQEQVLQDLLNKQSQIYSSQYGLAEALARQMQGQGPNPAETALKMNVNENLAKTQGLIASQRGLNPALAARLGVNQGVKANQEATMGAALLQQQQQLAAQQQLGGLYGQMQQGNLGYQDLFTQSARGAQGLNQATQAQNAAVRGQVTGGLMQGASSAATMGMKYDGGYIEAGPGQHAEVSGDSPKNDKIPALLSEGEIVIPKSKSQDADKAHAFLDAIMKESPKKKGEDVEYSSVLQHKKALADIEQRLKALEKKGR